MAQIPREERSTGEMFSKLLLLMGLIPKIDGYFCMLLYIFLRQDSNLRKMYTLKFYMCVL